MFRVVLVDGYVDEPACFGVPPYISPYVRYVAGAVWDTVGNADIKYFTIDFVRENFKLVRKAVESCHLLIIVMGVTVPGKYLGGKPLTIREAIRLFGFECDCVKVLGGPAARFGCGFEGGKLSEPPEMAEPYFDAVVSGDIECYVKNLLENDLNPENVDPTEMRPSSSYIRDFAIKGAKIVTQHPNYPDYLICEIETYRGCPRSIVGGCSFCTTPLYGPPDFRPVKDIVDEVKALYKLGIRAFRLGCQPDLFAYMAHGAGEEEFPRPNPEALRKLYSGIRRVAPNLRTLHMDNGNPGTIAKYPEECREIAKIIISYHTPGDVVALGIESADPKVIKANNLKTLPEESLEAIKLLNEVGAKRGYNGLPELLPGINFVHGLPGETRKTFELNYQFLKQILEEKLLVRRINIRQVIPFPGTRIERKSIYIIRKHKRIFKLYKEKIRREIDHEMLKIVIPTGTVLREVYTEKHIGNYTYARQLGTYPILTVIHERLPLGKYIDVKVADHGMRSVTAVPYPLDPNTATMNLLQTVPGIGKKVATRIVANRPYKDLKDFMEKLESMGIESKNVIKWFT